MQSGFTVEPMGQEHLDGVMAVEVACFSEPWSREAFESELRHNSAHYFVALEDGAVVGFAGMQVVLDEGYVTNVAVLESHRRKGIARKLVTTLLQLARFLKLTFVTLEVRVSNTGAQTLYRSMGFVKVGQRKNFYRFPPEDALLMTKTPPFLTREV